MEPSEVGFFSRLAMAFGLFFRVLFSGAFAAQVLPTYRGQLAAPVPTEPVAPPPVKPVEPTVPSSAAVVKEPAPVSAPPPPEVTHASGLWMLSVLQREGRLVDFLQEEVAGFTDSEVGAAARVVHEGCRKVLEQYVSLEPVLPQEEGERVTVPSGFDAQRMRLTGNVTGQPPFQGELRHHGWVAKNVRIPVPSSTMDATVIAPAEVEL